MAEKVKRILRFRSLIFSALLALGLSAAFASCASQGGTLQAEEYYTIGMAYFELGRFSDAEMWLNRARATDKTMIASEYNLGRIAYETGRYDEAARYFESILERDPENVMALKAVAYLRIKNGDMEEAEAMYNKVLSLIPESADDGFNYALVLYGLKKYETCEEVLLKYPHALEEKAPSVLLLARAQKALNKVEAVDSYAKWLTVNKEAANPQGLLEYAEVLESAGHYARALEQYQAALAALPEDIDPKDPAKAKMRFGEARLLLTADPENEEGMTEFTLAIEEGFEDVEAIEALLADERVTPDNQAEIGRILTDLQIKKAEEEEAAREQENTAESGEEADDGSEDGTETTGSEQ